MNKNELPPRGAVDSSAGDADDALSLEEQRAIELQADLRKRQQRFKVDALNLEQPSESPGVKERHEKILALVYRVVAGDTALDETTARGRLAEDGTRLQSLAAESMDTAPNLAAYAAAKLAKFQSSAGEEYAASLLIAREANDRARHIPKLTPASLLPDAMILGVEAKEARLLELPAFEKVAKAAEHDETLLAEYALVLPEDKRAVFLGHIPETERRRVSALLDSAVSPLLHQSIVEKKSPEEAQRKEVRVRLYRELRDTVVNGASSDKQIAKMLSKALGTLGEDSRQLILEIIRDEMEARESAEKTPGERADHIPRVMKVLLDNFDDFRGNDLVLQLASDPRLAYQHATYLYGKLIDKGYLEQGVAEWWNERKASARTHNTEKADKRYRIAVLQKVVQELGVIPSKDVLVFLSDDTAWRRGRETLTLDERIEAIRATQKEFETITDNRELIRALRSDTTKAMTYYLLRGGSDRFNLINNYSFEKFQEMLGLIDELKVHPQPLKMFQESLRMGGLGKEEIEAIVMRLSHGQFPLAREGQDYQEVNFEMSENAALDNANAEIGRVLGKEQLGVVVKYPMYREYLETIGSEQSQALLGEMQSAVTFPDRSRFIEKVELAYPDIRTIIAAKLEDNWKKLGEKMVLEMTLEQVMGDATVSVHGEELLPRLDAKRIDLKRMKKDLLVLLKGEQVAMVNLRKDISKKKKAREKLAEGAERQEDPKKKQELEARIASIDRELSDLNNKRLAIGELKASERFAHLSPEEKKAEIDQISNEIIALTEKSPSAIFTYITMQVLGEERLRESDIALVREMESHLQGPFQTIADLKTYERPHGPKKQMQLGMQYLDKTERLMTMVRFADSKICCFSSNNYEMRVQHDMPNKYWVASINADPLSFVISLEIPSGDKISDERQRTVKDNIGFIFGNFALDDHGEPAIMLNGIYYAPGIEDEKQVGAIMHGVEQIFKGLPIKTVAVATQYGGSVAMPSRFSKESIELTRLRALDGGNGKPETHIYDDLGTGTDLNRPHSYGEFVWHYRKMH